MNLDFQDGVSKLASQPIQVLRQLLGNPAHFKKYNSQYTQNLEDSITKSFNTVKCSFTK